MPISSKELKTFPNRYFVETGSAGLGWGIESALKAGFSEVHSIDINPGAFNECSEIFKEDNRVHLTLGDCGPWLDKTLNKLDEPCTIYLDANGWKDEKESPLDSSLEALIRHGKEHHIILIDDMNHAKEPRTAMNKFLKTSDLVKSLLKINPDYRIYLINTHTEDQSHKFPWWVLVADPTPNRFPKMKKKDFVI